MPTICARRGSLYVESWLIEQGLGRYFQET